MSRLKRALVIAVVLVLGVFAFASVDRCGSWDAKEAGVGYLARAHGKLVAGAGRAEFKLPWPVPVATSQGLRRQYTSSAGRPVGAKATLVGVGAQKVALIELDLLLLTTPIVQALRAGRDYPVFVVATHTHAGPGAFDERLAVELAALDDYRPEVAQAIVDAGRAALEQAAASLGPAALELTTGDLHDVVYARTGTTVDERLTILRFARPDGRAFAEWWVLAAHPATLRDRSQLDPDYPGSLDSDPAAVRLILQGAAGNASAAAESPQGFFDRVDGVASALKPALRADEVSLAVAQASLTLPRPVAPPQVPRLFAPLVENVLCEAAEQAAELWALHLGPTSFLFVPFEPTHPSGLLLEAAARTGRVVGLANGYHGYVEPEAVARMGQGEATRQYYPPELLRRLVDTAQLLGGLDLAATGLPKP